ncbi:IclR family transcriptional regulator [Paeniglutamicibacter sp.]|uniref:IclR family transcriptional regulator n=1 Tax=Paeniglutamicibacter sp. TaxID=1934391 RepID=UPI003988CE78
MDEVVAGNERILAVLHALVTRNEPTGVRELAQVLGASRSTVSRVLLGLVEHGLATATPQGTYEVGPRMRVLGAALHARHPLTRAAGGIIEHLAEDSDSTVLAAVHDAPRPQVAVIVSRRRPGPVTYHLDPGTIVPLHAGATGRSILGRVGLQALGDEPLDPRTPDTVTDRAEIERLLAVDRRAGYTISVGQQFPLAAGAAASFQCMGLTGSVSITRPRFLTSDEDLERFGPMARQAAMNLEVACQLLPTPSDGEPITYPAGSTALARIIRIMTALCSHPTGIGCGPNLARRIGANIATTNRLISSLLATGVALERQGFLLPGPRLLQWAALLGPALDIPTTARHIVQNLAQETGETIGLAQLNQDTLEAEMTMVVNGVKPLHYGLASGVQIPLHAGAAGKAILAHCPPAKLDTLTLHSFTENTQTDRSILAAELETIRTRGWATGTGERLPDAFGVSAPYFVCDAIAGSITATVARMRLSELDIEELAQKVKQAAQQLTQLLTVA